MKVSFKFSITLIIVFGIFSCHTSEHKSFYENGVLKEEYLIQNGKPTGEYKAYYPDGSPHAVGHYKRGRMDGVWKYYYPNNTIQSIQMYNKGKIITLDFWDRDGNQVVKNGTGKARLYYHTGQIMSEMTYKNNKLHGIYITWHSNGIKASELYYNEGQPVDEWFFWDEEGELIKTENYIRSVQ